MGDGASTGRWADSERLASVLRALKPRCRRQCSHVARTRLPARGPPSFMPSPSGRPFPPSHPGGFQRRSESGCRRPVPARLAGIRPIPDPPCCHPPPDESRPGGGLEFVPTVLRTPRPPQVTFSTPGRLWDLTTWMPVRADFHTHPTAAALTGLHYPGRLHASGRRRPVRLVPVRPLSADCLYP